MTWLDQIDVVMRGNLPTWHLVERKPDTPGEEPLEELVVAMQGVLFKKDLPPFHDRRRYAFRPEAWLVITLQQNGPKTSEVSATRINDQWVKYRNIREGDQ